MKKILNRFVDIWKLDFLTKFLSGEKENNKTTIWFWIVSNLVLTGVLMVSFVIFLISAPNQIISAIEKNVPDFARVTLTGGQLMTENIDEPFFREIDASNEGVNYDKKIAVIIDTHGQTYDITSLDEYEGGLLVLGDRAYTKDNAKINQLVFTNVPDLSFTKEDVITFVDKRFLFPFATLLSIFLGMILFFYFAVLRLLSASWWAFMLFVIMRIFGVGESFMTAYKAVLNFYFIPAIVVIVLGMVGFTVPFVTTIIFISIFIANLIWLNRQHKRGFVEDSLESSKDGIKGTTLTQTKQKK